MIEHANIFYVREIHAIGGVETYLYELIKKYKDQDIAVVCKSIAPEQRERISKYCRIYIHKKQKIKCKVAIINWDTSIINYIDEKIWRENAAADEGIYQTIHADYTHPSQGTPPQDPRIKAYLAITEDILKNYKKLINVDNVKLCRNPLTIDKSTKYLILVSPTRLTPEKGGDMMLALANELDQIGTKYLWFVITTRDYLDNPIFSSKNVTYVNNRLDLNPYYEMADWVVVPSETEGDSYTMREALYRGIPIVARHLPYFDEVGIEDGKNALFITEENIKEVAKKMSQPLKFDFEPIKDGYDELIARSKSHYEEDMRMKYRVKALDDFTRVIDTKVKRKRQAGEEWEINEIRLEQLREYETRKKVQLIEIVEEIKPESKPEEKQKKTKKKAE